MTTVLVWYWTRDEPVRSLRLEMTGVSEETATDAAVSAVPNHAEVDRVEVVDSPATRMADDDSA